jgi:hypothetical protein
MYCSKVECVWMEEFKFWRGTEMKIKVLDEDEVGKRKEVLGSLYASSGMPWGRLE